MEDVIISSNGTNHVHHKKLIEDIENSNNSSETNDINNNQLDKVNNFSSTKNLKKTESSVIDERKLIKKNKNYMNNNSNNKLQKSNNNNFDGIISPIEDPVDEVTANQIANKLHTNTVPKQPTLMSSNSATAVININSNQQQYINPMANHSVKNAYPILNQSSKDDLISNNTRTDSKSPTAAEKRTDTSPTNIISPQPQPHLSQQLVKKHDNNVDKKVVSAKSKAIFVDSRIVFLKIGQIDTRNERYDAEAYIECSWHDDDMFKLLTNSSDQRSTNIGSTNHSNVTALKNILKNINAFEYDPNQHWSPQLYIENAIGDIKEEVRHKIEIVEKIHTNNHMKVTPENISKHMSNFTVRVCEMRKLRGVFYERLELNDFPMDIQELSITLTSKKSNQDLEIYENKENPCSINTEDFLDQQEWDLFGYVKTTTKTINDPWRKYDRSGFSVTGFIARKPGYYLYNAYMLIFLITILGFVPFAFDPAAPQFRAQVTGLLLLTSVNFRWIVTQRLPSVPYLTSLDKYAIGSLLFLVCFCVWHSLIGSAIITTTNKKNIDAYVLYGLAGLFFIYNFGYIMWFVKMNRTIQKFKEKCHLQQDINVNNAKEVKEAKEALVAANNKNNGEVAGNNSPINGNSSNINSIVNNKAIFSNGNGVVGRGSHNKQSQLNQNRSAVQDTTLLMTSA